MKSLLNNGWHSRRLGDLIHIKHGYAFKGEYFSNSGPFVVLTPGNFYDEGGFKDKGDKEKRYVGEVPTDFILKKGDLLVAMTEQAEGLLGSSAIVPASGVYLHNQRLGLVTEIDKSEIDRKFLYYLFNTLPVRQRIRASASGTKVRHTSPTRIYEVSVRVPPIAGQRRIAETLSAYDDLIENNARRIKILEEMAQTLYREWFVHFRFPGHEKTKFVDSPLGKIPERWQVHNIGDVVETLGGGTPSTNNSEFWYKGEVTWFTPSDLTAAATMFITRSGKKISRLGLERSSARLFPPYSVMMTSRATIGVVAINTTEACTNQGFIICIPNQRVSAAQIYFWIAENRQKIIGIASGATYKEINRTEFRELPIVIADKQTNEEVASIVAPILKQIEALQTKTQNLCRTRDLLLPKLISGEIEL